jgi:hypothetical protein
MIIWSYSIADRILGAIIAFAFAFVFVFVFRAAEMAGQVVLADGPAP